MNSSNNNEFQTNAGGSVRADDSMSVVSYTSKATTTSRRSDSDYYSGSGGLNEIGNGDDNNNHGGNTKINDIAMKEQKAIRCTKIFLFGTLIAAIALSTWGVYTLVRNQEQQAFEIEFTNLAQRSIAISGQNIANLFEATEFFSTTVSSMAEASNMEWPKVVIPDYSAQAERLTKMSGAQMVVFATVVEEYERLEYEQWMRDNDHLHIQQSLDYLGYDGIEASEIDAIPGVISSLNITTGEKVPETRPGPYLVNWQFYPFNPLNPQRIFQNNNLLALQTNQNAFAATNVTRAASVSFAKIVQGIRGQVFQPIFESLDDNARLVGVVWITFFFERYFSNILPPGDSSMVAVLESSCGFISSFELNGPEATPLGLFDAHDPTYDYLEVAGPLFDIQLPEGGTLPDGACLDELTLYMYPTAKMYNSYMTNEPWIFAGSCLLIFVVTTCLFVVYDLAVNRRQIKVMSRLNKQDRLVADIFPEQIMARLYDDDNILDGSVNNQSESNGDGDDFGKKSGPIADLYLNTTVLFCDVDGFVGWSSQREPGQIFIFLEKLFAAFDEQARRFGVFKLETQGDMYVASTGVPDPDEKHAVLMARFAMKIQEVASKLTKDLERKLGPDTGDLEVRIGIHSGNVTGGVLRGERARFQLFGDTCNVAGLIHQTGKRRKIHVSAATAALLEAAGKNSWLAKRADTVDLGAKGTAQTFWLRTREDKLKEKYKARKNSTSFRNKSTIEEISEGDEEDEVRSNEFEGSESNDSLSFDKDNKTQRIVDWNTQILTELLGNVVAARSPGAKTTPKQALVNVEREFSSHQTVLEEFKSIITLPKIASSDTDRIDGGRGAALPNIVREELHDLLTRVADLYRDNEFHGYEHAAHVTASVVKMMKRITNTDKAHRLQTGMTSLGSTINDAAGHSYGISSDPLTQFTVCLCAVIHDVDHPGVTNAQLVSEKSHLAQKYNDKSVAEQNSVELFWDLLMSPEYGELRDCIYQNDEELRRFRQLLVNIVMATDICDKELGALRKNRWNLAFSDEAKNLLRNDGDDNDMDRKATIVLEHLIQASDVSHTMQHWDIYLLWNQRFFMECYSAYKAGRAPSDPSTGWYKGEIGFFDFYIIPLAKKLESCGVFGVSSHEYLAYAEANRKLWEEKGEAIVDEYLTKYRASYNDDGTKKRTTLNSATTNAAERDMTGQSRGTSVTSEGSSGSSNKDADLELGM